MDIPKSLLLHVILGLFKKEKKNAKGQDAALNKLMLKISEYIEQNISLINEVVELVFVEESVEKNTLYKTIEKDGEVTEFALLKLPQLIQDIKKLCEAYKVRIDNETTKYFIELCGTSMQDLINEIRKLIEYVGPNGVITKKEIDLLSIKQIDSVIFDLTDNLGKKDAKKAIEVLHDLIYEKEPIQKILITLYNHFKRLYIVKIAEEYKKDLATSMKLKPNQLFLTTKYRKQASYFSKEEIENTMEAFIDLDAKYKVGLIDINIGLESILCVYCS